MAFWLLCGRAPFETSSSIETIMAHLNQPPPDPRSFGVPDGLAAIILKTLEMSPSERFASMAEVVAALALV